MGRKAEAPAVDLDTLLEEYAVDARACGQSDKTVDHYRHTVVLFSNFLGGIGDVKLVTADDLRRFLASLRDRAAVEGPGRPQARKLSPASLNKYARAVRAFWPWLHRSYLYGRKYCAGGSVI